MAQYRKKPVVIEAFQIPCGLPEIPEWAADDPSIIFRIDGSEAIINTLEGTMTASAGDWIIKGVKGELYPCKPDIFAETYEPA